MNGMLSAKFHHFNPNRFDVNGALKNLDSAIQDVKQTGACCSQCDSHELNLLNIHVKRLTVALSNVLAGGLFYPIDGYWPLAQQLIPKKIREEIIATWKPSTSTTRGMAWLYFCLNEGSFSCYLRNFTARQDLLKKFYREDSVLRNKRASESFQYLADSLEEVQFCLEPPQQSQPTSLCVRKMRIGVKPTIKTAEVIETNGIEEVGRKEDMEESVSVASRATETSRNSKEPSVHSEVKPQLARHLNSCTSLNDFDTSSLSDFTGSCSEDVNVVRKGSKFRTKIRCLSTSEATDKQPLPNSFHESLPTPLGLRKPNELHSNDSLLSSIEISVADKPATPSALRKRPNLVPSINVELLEDTEICKEAVDVVYSFSESILSQKGPSIVKTKSKPSQKKLPARIVSLAGAEHPEISSTVVDRTGIKESQRKTFSTSSSNYSYDGAVIQSITDSARHMVICDLLRNEEALATSTPLNSPLHNHLGPQDSGNISDLIYEGGESTRFLTATDWTDQTESKPTDENLNNEVFHNERSSPEGHENPPPFVDQNQDAEAISPESPVCDFDKKLRSHLKQVSREKKSRLTSMEGLLASLGETNNMATPPSVHSMETTNSDTEDVAEEAVDLILQPNVPADDTVNEELLKDEENNNADLAVPPTTGEVHKQNASTTKFHESELLLTSSEIVELAINVFEENEKFYKAYNVHVEHTIGNPQPRLFVITHQSIYLTRRVELSSTGGNHFSFRPETCISFLQLDYITVGPWYQLFTVFKKGERNKFVITTADELLTRSILSSLELSIRRCPLMGSQLPNVSVDASQQLVAFQKWAASETHSDMGKCEILAYSLVYWQQKTLSNNGGFSPSRDGYLFVRKLTSSWFGSPEWSKSYFMLKGKKLYQFQDSTCKVGEKVFDLRKEIIGCRKAVCKSYNNCLELLFADSDEFSLQLASPHADDIQQWLQTFVHCLGLADSPETESKATACSCLITSDLILMCQEDVSVGFIRTLAIVRISHLAEVLLFKENFCICLKIDATSDNRGDWVISFSCLAEMERFHSQLAIAWTEAFQNELKSERLQDSTLAKDCESAYRLWKTEI